MNTRNTNTMTLDDFMQARLGKQVEVGLVVGLVLRGVLIAYDHDALILRARGELARPAQMVLWSSITTVSTSEEGDPA